MKELSFYFDFSSPFAYLGATQIDALAQRAGARLHYRPFLLGALFKAVGTPNVPLFTMSEPKRRHVGLDLHRWADHYGVPFRFPSRFPMNTVKPLRMVLQLSEAEMPRLVHPIFAAYWAEDRDISDDATLVELANRAGFEGEALLAGTSRDEVKQKLFAATDEAVKAGVCGVPSFLVGDLLFWGQDRLLFVEKALAGWRPREG